MSRVFGENQVLGLGCFDLSSQTMTGLPSTMVVEPLKIATLSYHLSFQI